MKLATPSFTQISKRENEVLHMIAHEQSTKEIAQKLFVSYETVHSHRKNLLRKLNVKNTAGLVRVAFERGYLRTHLTMLLMLGISILSFSQTTPDFNYLFNQNLLDFGGTNDLTGVNVGFTTDPDNDPLFAATFDGSTSEAVAIAPSGIGPDFSISVWIKPNDVLSKQGLVFADCSSCGFDFYIQNEKIHLEFPSGSKLTSDQSILSGEWSHIAVSHNNTSDETVLYVNDEITQGTLAGFNLALGGNYDLYVGSSNGSEFYNGAIDELKIYNQIISPEEIFGLDFVNEWLGNSADYEDPSNWSLNRVPALDRIYIPATANDPILSDKLEASLNFYFNKDIIIESGASVTIGNNNSMTFINESNFLTSCKIIGTLINHGSLFANQSGPFKVAIEVSGQLQNEGELSAKNGFFSLWIINGLVTNSGIMVMESTVPNQSIVLQSTSGSFTNETCGRLSLSYNVGADNASQIFTNNGYIEYSGPQTSFGPANYVDNGFQFDPDNHFPNDNTTELPGAFEKNGVYNGNDSGGGSLRCAIANAASFDTVRYQAAPLFTSLTSGVIELTKSVVIEGFGPEFNGVNGGSNDFRMFKGEMDNGGSIEFKGLLLSNGGGPSYTSCGPCFDTFDPIDLKVYNCIFDGNQTQSSDGGGIQMFDSGSSLTCEKTIFRNNFVGNDGGAIYANGEILVTNCLFENNTAGNRGGAIYMPNSAQNQSQIFINNTITQNNIVAPNVAGLEFDGGNITLFNNIIDNNGSDIGGSASANIFASHNLIGNVGSSGIVIGDQFQNISAGPQFVDPIASNFQLQATSPAVNMGADTILAFVQSTDLAMNPRLQGTIDMGAYEFFNESCESASFLQCGELVSGNFFGAEFNTQALPSCFNRGTAHDGDIFRTGVYYSFLGTGDRINIKISVDNFGFIPEIHVFKRDDPFGSLPFCQSLECLTTDAGVNISKFITDDGNGNDILNESLTLSSELSVHIDSEINAEYLILVSESTDNTILIDGNQLDFTLQLTCGNTDCNDWAFINDQHYMPSNIFAQDINFAPTGNKVLAGQSVVAEAQNSVTIEFCSTFEVELGAEFEAKIGDCLPDPCPDITSPTGTAQVPDELLRWNAVSFDPCINKLVFAITDSSPDFQLEVTDIISGNVDVIFNIVSRNGGGAASDTFSVAPGMNSFNAGLFQNEFGQFYDVELNIEFDGNQFLMATIELTLAVT